MQLFGRQDVKLPLPFLYQFSFCKFGSVANIESNVYLLLLTFPRIISNEMEAEKEEEEITKEEVLAGIDAGRKP